MSDKTSRFSGLLEDNKNKNINNKKDTNNKKDIKKDTNNKKDIKKDTNNKKDIKKADNKKDAKADNKKDAKADNKKDTIKDSIKDSIKDNIKDSIKDSIKHSIKDSIKDNIKHSKNEEEIPLIIEKKSNIFTDEPKKERSNYFREREPETTKNMFNGKMTFSEIHKKEEEKRIKYEKEEKERKMLELEKSLNDKSSFPELCSKKEKETDNNKENTSFIETLKKVTEKKEEYKEVIKPGWVQLTSSNNITNFVYGEKTTKEIYKPDFYDVVEVLTHKYYSWKNEYINNWGEDEYEKMYISPDYDYNYFDKLDEKYEYENAKENENSYVEDYMDYDYN